MKTIFNFLRMGTMVFALVFASCDGEDGMDGRNGIDGAVGAQGPAGQNGEDGNANVRTITYDIADQYPTNSITLILDEVSEEEDINDSRVTLTYLGDEPDNTYYWQVPGIGNGNSHMLRMVTKNGFTSHENEINVSFLDFSGDPYQISSSDLGVGYAVAKVIIIEASTVTIGTTGKSMSARNTVEAELNAAGVDISDYYQVAAYYGLKD